jgi:hypothetical protein
MSQSLGQRGQPAWQGWALSTRGMPIAANPAFGRDEPGGGEMGLMVARLKKLAAHGCPVF